MTPQQQRARKEAFQRAIRNEVQRALQGQMDGLFHGLGQNIDPNQELFLDKRRDFYIYAAQATALAVTPGQATDTIQIEADSNFILQKLTYLAFDDAVNQDLSVATTILLTGGLTSQARIIPRAGVQLMDTGSGRNLMQEPIPIPSFFGTGELPFILPNPRLFMRNSTIQVTFTNFDPVNAYDIYLAFIGYKVYGTA